MITPQYSVRLFGAVLGLSMLVVEIRSASFGDVLLFNSIVASWDTRSTAATGLRCPFLSVSLESGSFIF